MALFLIILLFFFIILGSVISKLSTVCVEEIGFKSFTSFPNYCEKIIFEKGLCLLSKWHEWTPEEFIKTYWWEKIARVVRRRMMVMYFKAYLFVIRVLGWCQYFSWQKTGSGRTGWMVSKWQGSYFLQSLW